MRLMSFSATTEQMRDGTKTVTRRIDTKGYWMRVLQPGTLICAIEKGQGLAKGEKVKRIGVIEIVEVFRASLATFGAEEGTLQHAVMRDECTAEGFPDMEPREFVDLFCRINRCAPDADVTRIEFEHRLDLTTCCGAEKRVYSGREGTNHYECSKCKEPV